MARRRRSLFGKIFVASVLGLAIFGFYTLYNQNKRFVNAKYVKVEKKIKAVSRALRN